MSPCPLLEDAGLPGLKDGFPGACMMEAFCFAVSKQSVDGCLRLCVCPPSAIPSTVSASIYENCVTQSILPL